MFNRALRIQVVKTDPKNTTSESEVPLSVKYADVATLAEKGIDKLGKMMISYVLVDTLRKVLIAKATKS